MVVPASVGFVGLVIRLPLATVEGTGAVMPAALVAPSSATLVMVANPPPPPVAMLPFTTPLEWANGSSAAAGARVVRATSPEVVVLADSSSIEVAASDGGVEAVSGGFVALDEVVSDHTHAV